MSQFLGLSLPPVPPTSFSQKKVKPQRSKGNSHGQIWVQVGYFNLQNEDSKIELRLELPALDIITKTHWVIAPNSTSLCVVYLTGFWFE